jgi:hypothetical protein
VEHKAIITMLKHLGFGDIVISWVYNILNTTTTSIILNGVPGKCIKCKRGVRQGDPLSPLLFVTAEELLQIIINHAWENNLISLPINESFGQN